ncbi:radical SAM protein [Rhizobium mesoamericanum]|uniref:radical SAM protein n=1 Tax=Rhizobium mesoamericanum TaxID=1079800 RepID=UPI00048A9E7B|nr:radical SAM protein [Rhizobium mesoamericanum]
MQTLRCNLACAYCQVSRETRTRPSRDTATLDAVLHWLNELSTKTIKIEFQGGEPLLRLDILYGSRLRAKRFDKAEFVVCTNLQDVSGAISKTALVLRRVQHRSCPPGIQKTANHRSKTLMISINSIRLIDGSEAPIF